MSQQQQQQQEATTTITQQVSTFFSNTWYFFRGISPEQLKELLSELKLTEDELKKIDTYTNVFEKRMALEEFIKGIDSFVKKWRRALFEGADLEFGVQVAGLKTLAKQQLNKLLSDSESSSATNRVAAITFAMDQKYVGSRDLEAFRNRINQLFEWHGTSAKETYMAPYFPIIQSSGMGKTRLMHEYRKKEREKRKNGRGVLSILCTARASDETNNPYDNVYDAVLFIPDNCEESDLSTKLGLLTTKQELNGKQENVFLFDESQHLLAQNGKPFRCIRWWLQEKRGTINFAAVFAGTNSALANFYNDLPLNSGQSRNLSKTYHDKGRLLYEPFFDICTIGCLKEAYTKDSEYENDYENAIVYGRPLFTLMHRNGALDGNSLYSIMYRMLLGQSASEWKESNVSLLSILATRVQMGSTSTAVVSTLVSQGYANLTQFTSAMGSNPVASYTYFPDPVCARLAMCLMDSEWTSTQLKIAEPNIYKGESPTFWTKEAMKLFANGMCTPNKGDLGEIAVALYLLFCGDMLRKDANDGYKTFGVSYKNWIALLKDPTRSWKTDSEQGTVNEKVGFIQFRRLHLRLPFDNMISQCFLKHLYLSGTACYLYSACPVFDIIASIQVTKKDHQKHVTSITYRPLLISIKAHKTFGAADIEKMFQMFDSKIDELAEKNINMAKEGVINCMLVLIGKDGQKPLENVSDRHVLIHVPHDDPFEATNLVLNSTSQAEVAEIYSSHDLLHKFALCFKEENYVDYQGTYLETFTQLCLRAVPNKGIKDYLQSIMKDMWKGTSQKREQLNQETIYGKTSKKRRRKRRSG